VQVNSSSEILYMALFATGSKTPYAALLDASKKFSQPGLRRHELWAATCYFRPEDLRELVDGLLGDIRLTDVYLVYNYAEDFRYPDLSE
jgi:hypothetical protein